MDETEVGQIEAWVGLDVGKADHHATVVSAAGESLFARSLANDEAAIEQLLDLAGGGHVPADIEAVGATSHRPSRLAPRLPVPPLAGR